MTDQDKETPQAKESPPLKKLHLKFTSKRKHNKSKNTHKLEFNMLRLIPSKILALESGFISGDASKSSEVYEIYQRIEERLTYPSALKSSDITGIIKAKIYFNSKGKFLEKSSKFEGNNYLKVLVARTIRAAFQEDLYSKRYSESGIFVECFFDFRLVTNTNKLRESKVHSKLLYFYRQGHGGKRSIDYVNNVVSGIFNVFSLLSYLPKSKEVKMKKKKELESYKNDSAWK